MKTKTETKFTGRKCPRCGNDILTDGEHEHCATRGCVKPKPIIFKHTPTPWKCELGEVNYEVYTDDRAIAQVDGLGEVSDEDEANARFIVQAVNSHDKLVEALSGLLEAQVCPLGQSKADRWSLACDKARAALAIAGVDQ